MLADEHHAIDIQFLPPQGERLFDRGEQFQSVLLDSLASNVTVSELVDVDAGDLDAGFSPPPIPRVSQSQPIQKVLRVRVFKDGSPQKGDPFLPHRRLDPRPRAERQRGPHHPARETATVQHDSILRKVHDTCINPPNCGRPRPPSDRP